MKIVARGCKYVRGKEGEQFFRRRIEAIRRGRIVKHDEATDGLTTSQQIAHELFGLRTLCSRIRQNLVECRPLARVVSPSADRRPRHAAQRHTHSS